MFCRPLRPRVSIVSSGHHNRYGHPDDDVMARLEARGDVWVTGGAYAGAPQSTLDRVKARDIDVWIAPDGSRFWVEGKSMILGTTQWRDSVLANGTLVRTRH